MSSVIVLSTPFVPTSGTRPNSTDSFLLALTALSSYSIHKDSIQSATVKSSVDGSISDKSSLPLKRVFSSNAFNTSAAEANQSVTFSSIMSCSGASDSEDSDCGNSSDGSDPNLASFASKPIATKKRRVDDVQQEKLPYCVPVGSFLQVPTIKCQFHKCNELSTKNTPFCGRHIGIKQCSFSGCNKCAQGSTKFCISHGGGRRCKIDGCLKGARDRNYCASHGGGKRCNVDGCSKSAVGGSDNCTMHGGGRKCSFEKCTKSAQSPTGFCVRHGGGRKCKFENCTKVARGKTFFCASHSSFNSSGSYEERVMDMEKEIVNRLIHLHKEIKPVTYTMI